ncbi:MAG: hypothetical protein HZA11_12325 [Nitrospirae bacterium]|nr:hypothetical protein [Nitrospirota bacterium]
MSLRTFKRIELAESQLKTAIRLFVSGGDKFSAISLAGAADVILCRLVSNIEKENFTAFLLKQKAAKGGESETIQSLGRCINDTLFINDLKHMDDGEDGYIDINIEECTLGAILKAIANYVILVGPNKDFVQAFLAWGQLNLDPKKYNIYCDPNWKPIT